MKQYQILISIILLFALLFILTGCSKNEDENLATNIPNTNTVASKTSTNINEELAENRITSIVENKNEILQNVNETPTTQTEISSYATTIKDKEAGRLTNISITCSTLNNKIIHKGETFSFNAIVGKPTPDRGYQEASVIIDHKTVRGIGGGNCQVSSTLYNAVLAVPNLVVIERHEHGKDVTYVPDGKDAAVSFGSLDFKFRNDTEHDICINAVTDNQTITIKLIQL